MTPTVFPAEVTLANAGQAIGQAREACRGGCADLSGLTRFDSAAVAVLVALRREFGPGLRLVHPPENLRRLATVYGVDRILFETP
jgi:ABC-type transporter Mla MlaB component